MTAKDFIQTLKQYARPETADALARFFKTGKGQYGEGDIFLGVSVPDTRKVCREFKDLSLQEIKSLLKSPLHECRLSAVILLSNQFKKADDIRRKEIFDVYLGAVYNGQVNNWDIVDTSAPYIVGEYLLEKSPEILFTLAKSDNLWQRRVAMLSSAAFIKKGDPSLTIELAEVLLYDQHDLIQKAVGWMLREVGKKIDRNILLDFLDSHAHEMPRTMLRYSIEHLRPDVRKKYMSAKG